MTPQIRVLGVDLSVAGTGLALLHIAPGRNGFTLAATTHKTNPIPKAERGYPATLARLEGVVTQVWSWATSNIDFAVLEDPTIAAQNITGASNLLSERGGLFWFTLARLRRLGVPFGVVSPSTLKLYATGKGDASKTRMVGAARAVFPRCQVPDHNAADAAWLAAMGAERLGRPVVGEASPELSEARARAMRSAAWPTLISD